MDWLWKKGAEKVSRPVDNLSLREVLLKPPVLIENYNKKPFFCKAAVDKLLTHANISAWIKEHPLHQQSNIGANDERLVDCIVSDHRLLFAVLVAAELESLTSTILTEAQSDKSLPKVNFESLKLSPGERQRLEESLQKFSPILGKSEHEHLTLETLLPFTQRKAIDKKGTFGKIYRVEVADGHLESYSQKVVAEKLVHINDPKYETLYLREVETLRAREHPNIEPLLASYSMKMRESDSVPQLHFIFPFADEGNLADWMKDCHPQGWLQSVSRQEQQTYLYHYLYTLVSGLSFLHREKNGTITAHHDLKPDNILVFGKELKIADFGRSHLHSLMQGSETDVNSGLGTYEYQPPEYWTDDGYHAELKHGRAFDMWSMGCIIVELATLIVFGWESEKVTEFRRRRQENLSRKRPELASRHTPDASFHNNQNIVEEWIRHLKENDDSSKMKLTLKVASQMMNQERYSRLYAWEAELDLYKFQHPDDDRDARLERGTPCVQRPPPKDKIPNGTQTPLHRAAETGDLTRLVQLVEAGWSLDDTDSKRLTPWIILKQTQPTVLCDDLRARLSPNIHRKAGSNKIASEKTPVRKGSSKEHGQELLKAAERGDLDMVRHLIEEGVDTLFVDKDNRSALFIAVENNQCDVAEYLLQVNGEELLRLKDNKWRDTALHKAASLGHVTIIKHLLPYCPNVEDKQKQEKTALFLAAEWDRVEAVGVLLDHGAQVFTQRDKGGTPLHAAAQYNLPQILRRLLRAPDVEKCLEHKNQFGDTPLWFALFNHNVECADILLEHGASLHVFNNDHANVIHVTVEKGLYTFLERNIHQFHRDEFRSRNRWNDTPLMIAQKKSKQRFVELLTSHTNRV